MRLTGKALVLCASVFTVGGCTKSALVEHLTMMEQGESAKKRAMHVSEVQPVSVENAEVLDVTEGQLYMECNPDSPFPQDYQMVRVRQIEPVLTQGQMTGEQEAERIYFIFSATPIQKGSVVSFDYFPRDKITNTTLRSSGIRCNILETIYLMGIKGQVMSYTIHMPERRVGEDIVTHDEIEKRNREAPPEPAIVTTEPLE